MPPYWLLYSIVSLIAAAQSSKLSVPSRYSANPVNNLFFKPPEETVKTYAEKQNEKMDLEVQTIKKLRAEMTREENMNITDAQLLEMLSNSTLDDDMLIF